MLGFNESKDCASRSRNLEMQNSCMSFHDLGFYQISILVVWEYTSKVFLFVNVGFSSLFSKLCYLFITVGVFFYFKF